MVWQRGKKSIAAFKNAAIDKANVAATALSSQTQVYSHVFYKRSYRSIPAFTNQAYSHSLRVYSRVSITAAKNLRQYLLSPQPPSTFTPTSSLHHNTGVGWLLVCFIRTFLCKESVNTRVEEGNNDVSCSRERFLFILIQYRD